jgi:hypothetical protein
VWVWKKHMQEETEDLARLSFAPIEDTYYCFLLAKISLNTSSLRA